MVTFLKHFLKQPHRNLNNQCPMIVNSLLLCINMLQVLQIGTVYYRVKAATLTQKIRCQNDGAAIYGGHQKLTKFPEEIRLLTERHLVFHIGVMHSAPVQCAMTELEKLRSP